MFFCDVVLASMLLHVGPANSQIGASNFTSRGSLWQRWFLQIERELREHLSNDNKRRQMTV